MSEQPLTPPPQRADADSPNELAKDLDALRVRGTVPCGVRRAWDFVTQPGWFINDGELRDHVVSTPEPGSHLVLDPVYGEFLFEDLDVVPPTQYTSRGSHTGGDTEAPATIVSFSLRELEPPTGATGGVTEIVITETGFAGLGQDDETRRQAIRANVSAWVLELRLAATALGASPK